MDTQQFNQGCPMPGNGQQTFNPNAQPGGFQQGGYQQGPYQQGPYQQAPYQQPCRPYVESTANNAFNCGPEGKCRGVYAILALALGFLGLHHFYINKVGAGIITIIAVPFTCGTLAIIPVIQGILALWTLNNEEFDRRFAGPTSSFFPLF